MEKAISFLTVGCTVLAVSAHEPKWPRPEMLRPTGAFRPGVELVSETFQLPGAFCPWI